MIPWRLAPKDANIGYNEIPWGVAEFPYALEKLDDFPKARPPSKSDSFNLTGTGEPLAIADGLRVTSGFFHILGITPLYWVALSLPVEDRLPGAETGKSILELPSLAKSFSR